MLYEVITAVVRRGPAFGQRVHVEILRPTPAPVQHHRAIDALGKGGFEDRLDRRETGARSDEDDRLVGVLAQEERAERPLDRITSYNVCYTKLLRSSIALA